MENIKTKFVRVISNNIGSQFLCQTKQRVGCNCHRQILIGVWESIMSLFDSFTEDY